MNDLALHGRKLRTMHLFAGAGGGILADILLGHIPVCAVELEEYPRKVLLARQREDTMRWLFAKQRDDEIAAFQSRCRA